MIEKSKLLQYFSSMSYTFFLAQLYSNWLCKKIIAHFVITSNGIKMLLGWGSCIVIAFVLHEVFEKRITRFLKVNLLPK